VEETAKKGTGARTTQTDECKNSAETKKAVCELKRGQLRASKQETYKRLLCSVLDEIDSVMKFRGRDSSLYKKKLIEIRKFVKGELPRPTT